MHILLLGGTSDIGTAIAHEFAVRDGATITLASRDEELLEKRATDLAIRANTSVDSVVLDITADDFERWYRNLESKPDLVICAVGYLGDEEDLEDKESVLEANFLGPIRALEVVKEDFISRGAGSIIGISSVAGERGKKRNYCYGAAKAGFSAYLAGLRGVLQEKQIHVMTVIPGYVDTKMTQHLSLPKALTATPEEVGHAVYKSFKRKRNVIFVKPVWRLVCFGLNCIPEFIFKRLSL